MLKREPRKNLLSGSTEWNRELGGYGGGLPPPTYAQARTAEEPLKRKKGLYLGKKACISESMHFSAMHYRRKKSSVDAFYPYLMLKPTKSEKKFRKKNFEKKISKKMTKFFFSMNQKKKIFFFA